MEHMSARSTNPKRLTLHCKTRKSALAKQPTAHLSNFGYTLPAAIRICGYRALGISSRRPEWKPWPKFSWPICRQVTKVGLFRPPMEFYLPSPNFPPCPTATIGCSVAAPTRRVRLGRCPRRVRRQSWTLRGRLRGLLDFGKVL